MLALRDENAALKAENARLQEELGKKGGPPPWVKANTPPCEPKPHKKRAQGASRPCVADPDAVLERAVDTCPDCGHALTGGWEYSSLEVRVSRQPASGEVSASGIGSSFLNVS